MKTFKYGLVVTVVFLSAGNITACNTIAGFFPDKEKDYHYHKELPELELPPDLQNKANKRQYISDDDKNLDEIFRITKEYNIGSINP